jgi:hypothetical protein
VLERLLSVFGELVSVPVEPLLPLAPLLVPVELVLPVEPVPPIVPPVPMEPPPCEPVELPVEPVEPKPVVEPVSVALPVEPVPSVLPLELVPLVLGDAKPLLEPTAPAVALPAALPLEPAVAATDCASATLDNPNGIANATLCIHLPQRRFMCTSFFLSRLAGASRAPTFAHPAGLAGEAHGFAVRARPMLGPALRIVGSPEQKKVGTALAADPHTLGLLTNRRGVISFELQSLEVR